MRNERREIRSGGHAVLQRMGGGRGVKALWCEASRGSRVYICSCGRDKTGEWLHRQQRGEEGD